MYWQFDRNIDKAFAEEDYNLFHPRFKFNLLILVKVWSPLQSYITPYFPILLFTKLR